MSTGVHPQTWAENDRLTMDPVSVTYSVAGIMPFNIARMDLVLMTSHPCIAEGKVRARERNGSASDGERKKY